MSSGLDELRTLLRQGRHAQVLPQVEARLASPELSTPDRLNLRLLRADALRGGRRMADADAELAQGLADSLAHGLVNFTCRFELEQARQTFNTGDIPGCEAKAQAVLATALKLGDGLLAADARYLIGLTHAMREETAVAQREVELAAAAFEDLGEEFRLAEARSVLAMLLVKQGRNLEGINIWRRSLIYHENEGHTPSIVTELERIGFATWCEGDLETTRRTLQHVLGLYETHPEVDSPRKRALTHYNMANVETRDANLEQAAANYALAASHNAALQDKALQANLDLQRAVLAVLLDDAPEALRLRAAALALAEEIRMPWSPVDHMLLALVLAAAGRVAQAQGEWPASAYRRPDGEQRMALRGVLQVIEALLNRDQALGPREQLELWWEEVSDAALR